MKHWSSIEFVIDGKVVGERKADPSQNNTGNGHSNFETKSPSRGSQHSNEESSVSLNYTPDPSVMNEFDEMGGSSDLKLPKKRAAGKSSNELNPNLINRILKESSGSKKKEAVQAVRQNKIDAPCITYRSKGPYSSLKLPPALPMLKILQITPPKERSEKVCECGKKAKYRQPKTLKPFCGLECLKLLLAK
ncbi:unnamed protein product [Blepharisma stoltei]|uniref:INO80 complex subunit B-like conserved region domain-containing protein n=1 Tax=Blepharisma stoltei TaxID=1481888 RepID=A0AAU9JJR5_9CILI|nr:unnamed protein product [Blepharisma stoltei]